jgi:hypothetical protein
MKPLRLLPALFILAGILFPILTHAQNLSAGSRRNILFTDLMNGLPITRPPSGIQGEPYYSSDWRLTSVEIYDVKEIVNGNYTRYNIYSNELEFRTPAGIKAIGGPRVKNFTFRDTASIRFTNAAEFKLDGVPLSGFFEVLVDGPAPLFRKYYIIVKPPDYHPALNAGSRDTKLTTHSDLFCGKGEEVFPVKGKKKLMTYFGDKADQVEKFIKDQSVHLGDEAGLKKVFTYYNSLLK